MTNPAPFEESYSVDDPPRGRFQVGTQIVGRPAAAGEPAYETVVIIRHPTIGDRPKSWKEHERIYASFEDARRALEDLKVQVGEKKTIPLPPDSWFTTQ